MQNLTSRQILKTGGAVVAAPILAQTGIQLAQASTDISKLKRVKQTLVAPPGVPKHDEVAKGGPVNVYHSDVIYFMGPDAEYLDHFGSGATPKAMAARLRTHISAKK